MTLPPQIQATLDRLGISELFAEFSVEHIIVLGMLGCSLLLVAIALERLFVLNRVRGSLPAAQAVVQAGRDGTLQDADKALTSQTGPGALVLKAGLDRALGRVRGVPAQAMRRELKRVAGAMKARTWLLGTAGALMPFVGLFGTVIGVMAAFQAIGESGQGGFAIVSVGISQALVATAVGIAVALEGVLLFNFLQNIATKVGRDLALLVDELSELIDVDDAGGSHAGRSE
ncbi:MAG: MotA/TolQ/ExbB proton channel family protein [Alphaproteobacteria bacterium]|nr:MotA/TolQ/ExbB proton channel family protein [Alphaproteobacteria bacterium]